MRDDTEDSVPALLEISLDDAKSVYHLCGIYDKNTRKFIKKNWELFMSTMDRTIIEMVNYNISSQKTDMFLCLGNLKLKDSIMKPKLQYVKGSLVKLPNKTTHSIRLRLNERESLSKLVEEAKANIIGDNDKSDPPVPINGKSPEAIADDPFSSFLQELTRLLLEPVEFTKRQERSIRKKINNYAQRTLKELLVEMAHKKLTDSQVEEAEIERNEPPPVETPEADQQQQPAPQQQTQTPQDAADFVAEINAKNEIRDLLSSYFSRDSRVLILDRNNPHKQVVVSPPETKTLENFLVESKKSRWIESMLHKKHYMAGILTYLAKVALDIYVQVADNNRLDLVKAVPRIMTLSMASYLGLNDTQLELLRSWLRNECDLNLEYSGTELKRIDREAGMSTENKPTCDTYNYYCDDRDPETCRYWNSDLGAEIDVETDIHISHLFGEAKDKGIELTKFPT
jgi:hypothetical protein